MNLTPHVCKGLEAIWAYILCALLVWLELLAARFDQHLVVVLPRYRES